MTTSLNELAKEFHVFYQKISDIYHSKKTPVDKWNNIALYIHTNSKIVIQIFKAVKINDSRKNIKFDYNISLSQLEKQIITEADLMVKISTIILIMHHIIYELLSTEGNYYFLLEGQQEMQVLPKPINYYINISIKTEQNIYFYAYILLYALESLFNKHFYLGIDFEYTNKKIQLAQLNFEHNVALQSIIMMVNPTELEPIMMNDFVELIICNKYIKKILHGSDSLDIPYMYNHMLQDDSKKIRRFTRTLIDTRFLCEYYKLTRDEVSDSRCSIYDEDPTRSAIYYFKVISDEQQKKLTELLQSMPAPHDIQWNIHKMPKSQTLYAQYDVFYLKWFYYKMIHNATLDDQTAHGKKAIIELYKNVLNEITRFVYLERNEITMLMTVCKQDVDPLNNYFIRKSDSILKMIDIFNKVSIDLESSNPKVSINKLTKVNHFKVPVMTLIKRLVYGFVSQKCRIQKDKTSIWNEKMDNNFIFDFLDKMNYSYLFKMFKELSITIESRVREICQSK